MRTHILLASAAFATLLCAGAAAAQTDTTARTMPARPDAPATAPPRRVHHDRYLITAEEIQEHPEANAFDLIYSLRPFWMRQDGSSTAHTNDVSTPLVVRVNGQPVGGPEELRRIPVESIQEIRFVPGRDAVQMFGRDYNSGAVLVTLH